MIKKFVILSCIFGLFILGSISFIIGLNSKTPIDLDKVSPELVFFDYSIKHSKVTFNFVVDEDNFKEIYYRDEAKCRRNIIKYDRLCTRLNKSGSCFAVRDLCFGSHHMTITIVDKANNIFKTDAFDFTIDS